MITFDTNLDKIWNFLNAYHFVLNFHYLGTVMKHCRTEKVVHLTFFRKIIIETLCIECGHDHFWCQFDNNMNFSKCPQTVFWIFTLGHCYEHCRTKNVVHLTLFLKNCHQNTVYRLWKMNTFDANLDNIWIFLNVSITSVWFFIYGTVINILGPKEQFIWPFFGQIVIKTQSIDCGKESLFDANLTKYMNLF